MTEKNINERIQVKAFFPKDWSGKKISMVMRKACQKARIDVSMQSFRWQYAEPHTMDICLYGREKELWNRLKDELWNSGAVRIRVTQDRWGDIPSQTMDLFDEELTGVKH